MARFSIISKDGDKIRYEGKPRYIGTYLKPSYLEFSEIASPTPIDWQVGDYVDYPRTGMRYRLYSIPQASKNARKGSHGRAFTYSNVQLHAATKELEIALFKDLVSADNNIHFSTSPDVATFENVYGIARRIQACMDDLYPDRWLIQVADFDASEDAEILEKINTAKDFALSGGTCLDALTKIYELWQEVGWIHTYDSASGKDVITIGYANKRIGANTTEPYIYGKGNGLTAIKKTQANKDEFATRLYVYGSDRNLPSRYYNNKNILNAESLDIRNLMLPIAEWGKTGNSPDARKAYLENAEAVAKYGVIPKTHYFDSDDAGADIYPTIEGITIGQVRRLQADYKPSTSIYPNDGERIDEVKSAVNPNDDGVIRPLGKAYKYYKIENVEAQKSEITLTDSTVVKVNKILLLTDLEGEGKVDMTVIPNIGFALDDAGFTEVNATFELTDSPTKTKSISQLAIVTAKKNEATGRWEFKAPRISVDYDYESTGSIPVSYVLSLEATLGEKQEGETITFDIEQGEIEIGANALLDKEFTITLKQIGFNIEERASIGSSKTISMKTGDNEGRNFVIKECRYEGSSDSWILTCRRQQDNNLGMLFPNKDYQIKQNDRFALLDIAMPELYVAASMERLFAEGQKLLSKVSRIQNNYEPSIDAKVMAESGRTIREGMFMQIADEDIIDGATEYILIDTINIYEDEAAIPTYKVTLKEKKKVSYKGTPSATSTPNTSPVEGKTDIDLSNYVTKEQFKSVENLKDFFYKTEDGKSIGTRYNLFSEKEVSAKGLAVGEASGSGIIKNVLGLSSLGSVESNDNTTTFNAYAIDSIYKKVVELEQNGGGTGGGGSTDADLSNYYTKLQTNIAIATALEPYAKTEELDGKYAPLGEHNTIKTKVETLDVDVKAIEGNLSAIGEKVDTLDGNLSTLNGRVNALDEKVADYDTFKQSTSTSIENLGKKDEDIASDIEGLSLQISNIKADVNKVLGWFDVDENNNLFTTFNFYSTEEISANGFNASSGEGGSGLITTVLGASSFGSVSSNDNTTTFNAYAIDSLYKRIIKLEDKDVEVDLSDYYTKGQTQSAINTALVPYLKSADADGKYAPLAGFNTLKSDFDALNKALNDDVSGKVNTWNEIVDFLDEYSGSESLAVILERMNADINSRVLQSTYSAFLTDEFNPLKTKIAAIDELSGKVDDINLHIQGVDQAIVAIQKQVDGYDGKITALENWKTSVDPQISTNKENIEKLLGWFKLDTDGNLYTEKNFYSTKEISANGLSAGGNGGGLITSVLGYSSLGSSISESNSVVFNAYATNQIYNGLVALQNKVDNLPTSSSDVSWSGSITTGKKIGSLTINGSESSLYAPATYGWSEITDVPDLLRYISDEDETLRFSSEMRVCTGGITNKYLRVRHTSSGVFSVSYDSDGYAPTNMQLINATEGSLRIGAAASGKFAQILEMFGGSSRSFRLVDVHQASKRAMGIYALNGSDVRGGVTIGGFYNNQYYTWLPPKSIDDPTEVSSVTIIGDILFRSYADISPDEGSYVWMKFEPDGNVLDIRRIFTDGYGDIEVRINGYEVYHKGNLTGLPSQASLRFGTKTYNGSAEVTITTDDIKSTLGISDWALASSAPTYSKSDIGLGNVENKSSATIRGEITSSDIISALGYTPFDEDDFTKANIKSTLGISNWALAANAPTYEWTDIAYRPTKLSEFDEDASHRTVTDTEKASWNAKSDFSGDYKDLTNKPIIPSAVTEDTVSGWGFTKNTGTYSKPSGGIPKDDLAGSVQTSLGKADTALQSYTEQYKGTVTGVKINGTTKNPSSGVVDLGTVLASHQSIYALTINNSAGAAQVTYTPNSQAKTLTLTKSMVGLGSVENTALSTWTGSANISTVGTITSGKWQGTAIANSYLANSKITIAGTEVSLGGSITASTIKSAIMGSTALGGTSAYLYWTGTAWGTKTLGSLAFKSSLSESDIPALSGYLSTSGGTIDGPLTVAGTLAPDATNSRNLGSSLKYWNYCYAAYGRFSNDVKIGSATLSWDSNNSALKVNYAFYSTGEISAKGLYTGSDIRFKNKIEDAILDLDTIANAPMFKFTWNNKEDGRVHIGSSAQYWKEHASELVNVDKDDFHSLDYATLGVLMGVTLGKKAKNHEERIKELELKVESLEAENRRLRYEC